MTADDNVRATKYIQSCNILSVQATTVYTYLQCAAMQATQHARETLEGVAAQGKLGKAGRGGKVIYAQTDSIFASFPNATTEEAIQVCKQPAACKVLCCAVLCCAVLCCAVLCCAVLCCAVLQHDTAQMRFTSWCCRKSHSQLDFDLVVIGLLYMACPMVDGINLHSCQG